MDISVDYFSIEQYLWFVHANLIDKYGTLVASNDLAPLEWYIQTGRASTDFVRTLMKAKPFMVARKLHKGGSYDEVINRVKKYIGWEE